MNIEELILNKDIKSLRKILKTCSIDDLGEIKKKILDSKLLSSKSIGASIGHREGRKPISELGRLHHSINSKRNWSTGTTRESRKVTDRKPSVIKKRSESSKRAWKNPQTRKLQSEIQKIVQNKDSVRIKKSVAMVNFTQYRFWNYKYRLKSSVVILQSSYELMCVQSFKEKGISLIRSLLSIPYINKNGKISMYHPDFEYDDSEGYHWILEVKPRSLISTDKVQLKLKAINEYIKDRSNLKFRFITESDLNFKIDYSDPNIIQIKPPRGKWEIHSTSTTIPKGSTTK